LEKAIDIKRRAQRSIQNGDLDGALKEYEKLIAIQDSDPYNFVLLADLLFKKGDSVGAAQRYITAIESYEKATLFKNAIAVGKKMMRLSLSPTLVLHKLAVLHHLDGLGTESALFYQQYAEHLLRDNRTTEAADALRKAFEASPENIKALERLADVFILDGDNEAAVRTLGEAAVHYQSAGLLQDADRCRVRSSTVSGGKVPSGPEPVRPMAHLGTLPPGAAHGEAAAGADVAADAETFQVERSHMTSLSDSGVKLDDSLEIERAPEAPGAASGDQSLSADITHSMEITPVEGDGAHAGPPALQPMEHEQAVQDVRDPRHAGPPRLDSHVPAEAPAAAESETALPGLDFTGPAAEPVAVTPPAAPEAPAARPSAPEPAPAETDAALVERLLREAREQFRKGERDAASHTLVRAAGLYDELGHFDSAATIYRNLGRSNHAPAEVMTLWLRNCEARNDRLEAAQVACELGDRSLNDGDTSAARDWFRRANSLDAANETAKRRLQRLDESRTPNVITAAPAADSGEGRVEIAVGRSEAVTFDLGSLVSEFQRGVESQISGDPQGHYDLGMAYREMGLLEQAIESFRGAGRDPAFAQRCAEMVGRSMLDQGRFEEAAQEFIVALELPGLSPEGAHDMRFQLGLAYEAAGRGEEALAEFERVYAGSPSYPDVALKIRVLRQALGTG
jgi:tetratricopeptide (TPR) repeat protein